MANNLYAIEIHATDQATVNQFVMELSHFIENVFVPCNDVPKPILNIEKSDQDSQDFGDVLVAIVSSAAVGYLAKGIANWLARRQSSSVSVKNKHGHYIVSNLSSKQAVDLALKLQNGEADDDSATQQP